MNSLLPNFKLKKVGKPLDHSDMTLNEIPYDYTQEVTNRFEGLYLIEWRTMDTGS